MPCSQVKADMFSMTPGHPEMALAGHVGGPGRHLLGGQRRGGHDQHLGARQHAGQTHLDVAGARGHVDEEVVELAPADVLEELLDGPVQDEAPPHDGRVLVGQEPHRHHLEQPGAHRLLEGHDLLALGAAARPACRGGGGPRSPRCRRRGGRPRGPRWARATARLTVTDDLPTPPLPEDTARTRAVAGMSVARARSSWALRRARSMSALRSAASISPMTTSTQAHAGQAAHPGLDVGPELGAQGAAGHGQGHLHLDPAVGVDGARPGPCPGRRCCRRARGRSRPSSAARTVSSAGGEEGAGTPPILPPTWSETVRLAR